MPAAVPEFAQRGIFPSDPDITGNLPPLLERHVEFRPAGEFEGEHFTGVLLSGQDLQPAVARDPVVEMDHEVVCLEIIEAQSLPREGGAGTGPSAPALFEAGGAAEEFGIGEEGQFGFRQGESAGQGAEEHGQFARGGLPGSGQLAQPGRLTLVGADDAHRPSVGLPLRDLAEKIAAALLEKNDVPCGEIPERVIGGEDVEVFVVGQHGAGMQSGRRFGGRIFDREEKRVGRKVRAQGGVIHPDAVSEAKFAAFECFDRALGVGIVGADGFNFVAEKFETQGQDGLPGEDIDNAAAHGVVAALRRRGDAGEAGAVQLRDQVRRRQRLSPPEGEGVAGQLLPRGCRMIERGCGDHDERRRVGVEFAQCGEAGGGHFGIRVAHASGGQFEVWHEEGALVPELQVVVEFLLAFDVGTDHADRPLQIGGQPCGKERLGRGGGASGHGGRTAADGLEPGPRGGAGLAGGKKLVVHGTMFSRRRVARKVRPRGPGVIAAHCRGMTPSRLLVRKSSVASGRRAAGNFTSRTF